MACRSLRDYRSIIENHVRPTFGGLRLEDVTVDRVERWQREIVALPVSNRQKAKIMTLMHGLMARARRVWRLPINPAADLDKPRSAPTAGIDVLNPDEILALARAAEDEQDAAIYITAAFTGLRQGELVALRWRDVDFAGSAIRVAGSFTNGQLTTPKSGKVRSVPMAPEVAERLARLGQRQDFTGDDDVAFVGIAGTHLDASALLRRYKRALKKADIRPLRFHDLRHTFGTTMITRASILQVKSWMGHADVETTMEYLHYAPRHEDAALVAEAFAVRDGSSRLPHTSPGLA